MKTVALEKTDLPACIEGASSEQILVTKGGMPVALVVRLEGLDSEQVQLGASARFWKLIRARRAQKTLSRAALEKRIAQRSRATAKSPRRLRK